MPTKWKITNNFGANLLKNLDFCEDMPTKWKITNNFGANFINTLLK